MGDPQHFPGRPGHRARPTRFSIDEEHIKGRFAVGHARTSGDLRKPRSSNSTQPAIRLGLTCPEHPLDVAG